MLSRARPIAVGIATVGFLFVAATVVEAATYHGESRTGNVDVTIRTGADGIPQRVNFSKYEVKCTGDYTYDDYVYGFREPFQRATPRLIHDKIKSPLEGRQGTFATVLKARRSGDVWRGRFRSRWVFEEQGEVVTRCGYAFRFDARLRP